jgi:rhodanese-related sulfurtransferase
LLLALLVVEAGASGAPQLLAVTGVVVLVSVLVHGVTATPASRWYAERIMQAAETPPEERESDAAGLFRGEAADTPRVSVEELRAWLAEALPPVVLDVRSRAQYAADEGQIPGSVRVPADQIQEWARGSGATLKDRKIVTYCTCHDEATSARVARQLRAMGFDAYALAGGYAAWGRKYEVEAKSPAALV